MEPREVSLHVHDTGTVATYILDNTDNTTINNKVEAKDQHSNSNQTTSQTQVQTNL